MYVNHIGVTVGDLTAGVQWYSTVFGLTVLVPQAETDMSSAPRARRQDIFGERFGAMRLAHLIDSAGVGIEIYEFIEPKTVIPDEAFAYWNTGFSHLAFTVEDLEGTLETVVRLGGRTRSGIYQLSDSECRICYCEDPWGTAIELCTRPHESIAMAGHRQG
jgi:predicted enzyme related to lactoylglutathione lyase